MREKLKIVVKSECTDGGAPSQQLANELSVVIYMHTMHAWLTLQMLWQMHGRTQQAVHMLIVCMGIF